jgi:maltooligosyltrehalose synthase
VPLRGGDALADRHLFAFARRLGTRVAIIVVPRFVSQLLPIPDHWPPLGAEIWQTLHVELPETLAETAFRDALTGGTVRPLIAGRGRALLAADLFKTVPLAVLLGASSNGEPHAS